MDPFNGQLLEAIRNRYNCSDDDAQAVFSIFTSWLLDGPVSYEFAANGRLLLKGQTLASLDVFAARFGLKPVSAEGGAV